jgi:hypothetical protein
MQTQANRSRRVTSNFDFSSGRRIRKNIPAIHQREAKIETWSNRLVSRCSLSLSLAPQIIKKMGCLSTLPLCVSACCVCVYELQSLWWFIDISLSCLAPATFVNISSSLELKRSPAAFFMADRFLISLSLSLSLARSLLIKLVRKSLSSKGKFARRQQGDNFYGI